MGIDRERIAENFYPAGSERRGLLHPVRDPVRLRRRSVARLRRGGRQAGADRRRLRLHRRPTAPLPRRRPRLHRRTRPASRPRSRRSSRTTSASTSSSSSRRTTPSWATLEGQVPDVPPRMGRRLSGRRRTSSTSTSAPARARSSGRSSTTSPRRSTQGAASPIRAERHAAYTEANNADQAARPGGPDRSTAARPLRGWPTSKAPTRRRSAASSSARSCPATATRSS